MTGRWIYRPDVVDYVVESYAGTEECEHGPRRRVFIWEEGRDIKMGNTEAFLLHLTDRFGLLLKSTAGASDLHKLLRELGEPVQTHKPHAPKRGPRGAFRQPDPESWTVRTKPEP